jgi:site-specific recombinase XerD
MVRRNLAASTIDKRMGLLARVGEWLERPVHTADVDELRAWLDTCRLTSRSRACYVSHLSSFWSWLLVEELVDIDVTLRLERPRLARSLPRPVSTDTVAAAMSTADPVTRCAVALAAFAGMRCAEIAQLRRCDVLDTLRSPTIVVRGKGGHERMVPAHPAVLEAVNAVTGRSDSAPLLGCTAQQISARLRYHLVVRCGVPASGHQLRHWFATECFALGGDLRIVQELLGHASPVTTAVYTAWSRSRATDCVERLSVAA